MQFSSFELSKTSCKWSDVPLLLVTVAECTVGHKSWQDLQHVAEWRNCNAAPPTVNAFTREGN